VVAVSLKKIEADDFAPGAWAYEAWQYIPSSFESGGGGFWDGSYFMLLNTYFDAGPQLWSVQMQFDSNDGLCKVFYGDDTNTIDVPYTTDRWVKIQAIIDKDEDWTRIYYDDELVTEYTWTGGIYGGGGGALDIAVVDLFARGSTRVHYDDLKLEAIPSCGGEGLDDDADTDGFTRLQEYLNDTDACDPDTDDDTVPDGSDNCPGAYNPDQADDDDDGHGDTCDPQWDEPFDDYAPGDLSGLGGWEPWDGDPGAAGFTVTPERFRSDPHSLRIDGVDDAVRQYAGYDTGLYEYSTWIYVPVEFDSLQYLVLLNTYPAVDENHWSLQIELDGATDRVNDFDSDGTLPLIREQWVEIRVEIDLVLDEQTVFYGDDLLVAKGWSDGNQPGGAINIAAVDLYAAGSASPVFYDDLTLADVVRQPCPADLDGDGIVGFTDLLEVLAKWGPCGGCVADIDHDGFVGFTDLLEVLSKWGPCED
jgi:hypothetical protein